MINSVLQFEAGIYFLYFKKHYCCNCGSKLERKLEERFVEDNSIEAKEVKSQALFTIDSAPIDDVKLYKYIFVCNKCFQKYSVKEIKRIEKPLRYK